MEIIEYRKSNDIDVYFEEYNWIFHHTQYDNFRKGTLKCPYERRTYNIGYLGEGKYKTRVNNRKTEYYEEWIGMLRRCYNNNQRDRNKRPKYDGWTVCEEWHNFQNFAEWYEENYYEIKEEKMCLDKDILVKGNKIYSPQTCVFVPNRINVLFTKSDKIRGDFPIGVTYHKRDKVFESKMCYMDKNKIKHSCYLGRYNTSEEAFESYKKAKENYIKQVADEYKLYIPKELYDAMYDYRVEITD